MKSVVEITKLTPESKGLDRLYEIMLHAYSTTEEEIWGKNYTRMPRIEFNEMIALGKIFGLYVDTIPVGSIQVSQLRPDTYVFGLLSVDFGYKGMNLGRKLIEAAEKEAKDSGAKFMELEILRLKEGRIKAKQILHDWYVRQGYRLMETIDFVDRKPTKAEKAELFVNPSVFDCYRKEL